MSKRRGEVEEEEIAMQTIKLLSLCMKKEALQVKHVSSSYVARHQTVN